ncbi:MAG: DUF4359 domain-containing protein [Gloeomargaritaceae cyanobacterium C42_A2020_066]|nr:DUF4359 domain-containing protein [Gloeomargaritaceae cyanobacterium C42_A2020_066]
MKKVITIVILVMFGGLAVTNPGSAAYITFATQTLSQELCPRLPEIIDAPQELGSFLSLLTESCPTLLKNLDPQVRTFLQERTERRNLIIASLYTTQLFGSRYTTLGIARQFFLFPPQR